MVDSIGDSMEILITGGAGFIGSRVVDLFLEKGFEVVILDDLSTRRASNFNPRAKLYQVDLAETRDHVNVGDCVHENYLAVTVDDRPAIYNSGWGYPSSVNHTFFSLAIIIELSHQAEYGPARIVETRHNYFDATEVKRELDWSPRLALEEGFARTVAYFKKSEHIQ